MLSMSLEILDAFVSVEGLPVPKHRFRIRLDARGIPGGETMWDARYEETEHRALLAAHDMLAELMRRTGVKPGGHRVADRHLSPRCGMGETD